MSYSLTIKNNCDFDVLVDCPGDKRHLLVGKNKKGLHEVVSNYRGQKWYIRRVDANWSAVAVLDHGQVRITPYWGFQSLAGAKLGDSWKNPFGFYMK